MCISAYVTVFAFAFKNFLLLGWSVERSYLDENDGVWRNFLRWKSYCFIILISRQLLRTVFQFCQILDLFAKLGENTELYDSIRRLFFSSGKSLSSSHWRGIVHICLHRQPSRAIWLIFFQECFVFFVCCFINLLMFLLCLFTFIAYDFSFRFCKL